MQLDEVNVFERQFSVKTASYARLINGQSYADAVLYARIEYRISYGRNGQRLCEKSLETKKQNI